MARPNQVSNSGAPDQANSAYLQTIKTRAIGSYDENSQPKSVKLHGKRRIYQLGAYVPSTNQPEEETGTGEA
jgi:hypothetical protein